MNDPRGVRVRHRLESLQEEVDRFRDLERAALETSLEILALEKLHHDVGLAAPHRSYVHNAHDVLALQPGDRAGFTKKARESPRLVGHLKREHLDGHRDVEQLVPRPEYGAHSALS